MTRRLVRRTEVLNLDIPTEHADAVRAALVDWLHGYGITTAVTVEQWESGKCRIHAKLEQGDAAKLDLSSEQVQHELEGILTNTLHGPK